MTSVDILVDAPLLAILPQRITVDVAQILAAGDSMDACVGALLAQMESAVVDSDQRPVRLSADTCTVLVSDPQQAAGTFVPFDSCERLTQLARLRLAPNHRRADGSSSTTASARAAEKGAPDLSAVFSMIGNESRAFDPSAPVVGTLHITIVRCDGLFNVDTFGVSSPYVTAFGQGRKEVFRTEVAPNTLDPVFSAELSTFDLPVNDYSGHARFRVMARKFMDDFMGEATIEVIELISSIGEDITMELQARRNEVDPDIARAPSLGTITIRCTCTIGEETEPEEVEITTEAVEQAPQPPAEEDEGIATPSGAQDPPLFDVPPRELAPMETTSVMLDVVKLVVADAVASIPLPPSGAYDHYELSLRKLDVMRGGVMEDRGWSSRVPDEPVSHAFFRALMEGYQIGVGHTRRASVAQSLSVANVTAAAAAAEENSEDDTPHLREQVAELNSQVDALQRRLNACLNDLEVAREEIDAHRSENAKNANYIAALSAQQLSAQASLQSPNSQGGNRAPPCTPATQHAGGGQITPNALPLPATMAAAAHHSGQRHMDVNNNNDAVPNEAVNVPEEASDISPPAVVEGGCGDASPTPTPDENAPPTTIDAMVDFTMVVCFYNSFDYVTKTTRKKGRAVSLSASKAESRFSMLQRVVAETFREGLSISYLDVEGRRHIIQSDSELTRLLLALKSNGYRPVFQCFNPEEELDTSERVDIGSSPKRMFVMRSPAPPEAPNAALTTLVTSPSRQSSRPSSASINNYPGRSVSAMSVRSSASSMPYDYIAGSALDDATIAREFEVVSGGAESVSKEDVLLYLEARYDSIGDAGRFKRLLDSLFRRKTCLGVNEFAIVLLRLSQS